LRVERCIDG
jgi:hypothetical protein